MRSAGLVVAYLALVPALASAAEPLSFEGTSQLERSTQPSQGGAAFEFTAQIRLAEPRPTYFKVLPNPGNPPYRNGTAGASGWWTEAGLLEGGQARVMGSTNGSALVELGTLNETSAHKVWIRVHAPSGSLASPVDYGLNYVVAVREPANSTGSGASLNPSLLVQPHIVVLQPAGTAEQNGDGQDLASGMAVGILVAIAVLAIAGFAIVRSRRSRRPPPPPEGGAGHE